MSREILEQVVARAVGDAAFRQLLRTNPGAALREFRLSADERSALTSGDPTKLVALGIDQRMSRILTFPGDTSHYVASHDAPSDLSHSSGTVAIDPDASATSVLKTVESGAAGGGGAVGKVDITGPGRVDRLFDTQGGDAGGASGGRVGGPHSYEQLIPDDSTSSLGTRISTPGDTEARIGEPAGGEGGALSTTLGSNAPRFEQLIPSEDASATVDSAAGSSAAPRFEQLIPSGDTSVESVQAGLTNQDLYEMRGEDASFTSSATTTGGSSGLDLTMIDQGSISGREFVPPGGPGELQTTAVTGDSSGLDMMLIDRGAVSGPSATEITDVGEHSGDSASDAVVPLEPGATGATIDTDTSGLDSGIVPHPDTLGGGGDITP